VRLSTGKFPQDLSVNTNWATNGGGAAPNHAAGLPYQLPTPSGAEPSPYNLGKGGLPNVAVTLQKAGYKTAHYGKVSAMVAPFLLAYPCLSIASAA
jgi:hypothetical protein